MELGTMPEKPGLIVLIGSGETSASGRRIFDWLLQRLASPVRVAILETPAGFELNSDKVAGRIGDFLGDRLPNYQPQVTIVPARKLGTLQSPESPDIAALIPGSDVVFMGPGSPTYAVRQLAGTLTWQTVVACHRLGASLVLASAAAIAAGSCALPVYEIYKVGEDLHWRDGLDLLAPYGLSLVFVPHWNNQDGGEELDTSRCYMGQARFESLLQLLPPEAAVVGIDEKTALILDLEGGTGRTLGKESVTVLRAGTVKRFGPGTTFPLTELGPFEKPEPAVGLPPEVWQGVVRALEQSRVAQEPTPTPGVLSLVEQREAARSNRDWRAADDLRDQILKLGWQVQDTRQGPKLEPIAE
jgi:hypothetical protein